ncbi:uncharacterized protein METZ01_LOCUS416571, partial [marine metagenome]
QSKKTGPPEDIKGTRIYYDRGTVYEIKFSFHVFLHMTLTYGDPPVRA